MGLWFSDPEELQGRIVAGNQQQGPQYRQQTKHPLSKES